MTNKIYDVYQFHDSLLHGISFFVEDFQSELRLDIDHILQWPNCPSEADETLLFTVSKALLTFFDVTDLSINIDWGESGYTTAVSGVYIDMIERVSIPTSLRLPAYYKWNIVFDDNHSFISFGSSSMAFELIGSGLTVPRQFLLAAERNVSPSS